MAESDDRETTKIGKISGLEERVLTSRTTSSGATLILKGTRIFLERHLLWTVVAYFWTNFLHFQILRSLSAVASMEGRIT